MPDIVLATLNAKFIHAAFGLRYLLANLGDLRPRAALAEFDLAQRPLEYSLNASSPSNPGSSVSACTLNVRETTEVVALLKRIRPGVQIVLGGPEVSHETDDLDIVRLADVVIAGEADLDFPTLCRRLLAGEAPASKRIIAPPPELARIALPYDEYDNRDLAHRILYVEASRGCPFECEFCLSSLDVPVRAFPLDPFLAGLDPAARTRRPAVQVRGSHVQSEPPHQPRNLGVLPGLARSRACSSTSSWSRTGCPRPCGR